MVGLVGSIISIAPPEIHLVRVSGIVRSMQPIMIIVLGNIAASAVAGGLGRTMELSRAVELVGGEVEEKRKRRGRAIMRVKRKKQQRVPRRMSKRVPGAAILHGVGV